MAVVASAGVVCQTVVLLQHYSLFYKFGWHAGTCSFQRGGASHASGRFEISFVDNHVEISGCSGGGEQFEIHNVQWDGNILLATFRLPSTGSSTSGDEPREPRSA